VDSGLVQLFMPVAVIAALGAVYLLSRLVGLWLRARAAGAPVSIARIVRMVFLRMNPRPIIDAYAIAVTAQVDVTLDEIENHAMMGGRLQRVVVACAAAKKADVEFPFAMARAMDLTGRDAMDVVQDLIRAKRDGDREAAEQLDAARARALVGSEGEVTVAVVPPGMVVVDGQRANAVCSTGYLKKGAKVRIASALDNMVVVEPIMET
jgi:hypothetical protein